MREIYELNEIFASVTKITKAARSLDWIFKTTLVLGLFLNFGLLLFVNSHLSVIAGNTDSLASNSAPAGAGGTASNGEIVAELQKTRALVCEIANDSKTADQIALTLPLYIRDCSNLT